MVHHSSATWVESQYAAAEITHPNSVRVLGIGLGETAEGSSMQLYIVTKSRTFSTQAFRTSGLEMCFRIYIFVNETSSILNVRTTTQLRPIQCIGGGQAETS